MEVKYRITFSKNFLRKLKKYKSKDPLTFRKISQILDQISRDPFDNRLKTHSVNAKGYGRSKAFRVTGDIRIIWDFNSESELEIVAINIGGHDDVY